MPRTKPFPYKKNLLAFAIAGICKFAVAWLI